MRHPTASCDQPAWISFGRVRRLGQVSAGRGAPVSGQGPAPGSDSEPTAGMRMRPRAKLPLEVLCLVFCCGWLLFPRAMRAQAPIDPALPEAPLPHTRAFWLFPGYDVVQQTVHPVASLRPEQKFEMAYRNTVDLSFLVRSGIVTAFDKSLSVGPDYGRGAGGVGKLYAYNVAGLASNFFFCDGAVPALFHQDPRYFRKGSGSTKSRIWWALRSEFMGFSDRGRPMPNYGILLGSGISTLLSDTYLPARNVSVGKTFEGYSIKIGTNFGFNVLHEYGGVLRVRKILGKPGEKRSLRPPD